MYLKVTEVIERRKSKEEDKEEEDLKKKVRAAEKEKLSVMKRKIDDEMKAMSEEEK